MADAKKPEKKKKALDSFFKKGKKSSSKKKSDEDSSKQKEASSGWNIPEESAPSGAPKIQVKDLQSDDKEEDVKTRIEKEEFRARMQEAQKRSKQTAKTNEEAEAVTPEPPKRSWRAARLGGAKKPNLNSVAQFPSLKGNRGSSETQETTSSEGDKPSAPATQQRGTVWGAPVAAEDTVEEEQEEEEPPKKAVGEDVDLVPPLENQELSRADIKERAKDIIEDLRLAHEIQHFLSMVKLIRPSEDAFSVSEQEIAEPLYEKEDDHIDKPHLALQNGRMVIVEQLLETACDWDEDKGIVGEALKALMLPQNYDVTKAVEEEQGLEEPLEEPVYLYASLLDRSAVVTACANVLEFLDDIAVDVPKAADYFAEMLRPLVQIDEGFQKPCIPHDFLPLKVAKILEVDEETKEKKRKEEEEKKRQEEERKRKLQEQKEEFLRIREESSKQEYSDTGSRLSSGPPKARPNTGALKELLKESSADKNLPNPYEKEREKEDTRFTARQGSHQRPTLNLKRRTGTENTTKEQQPVQPLQQEKQSERQTKQTSKSSSTKKTAPPKEVQQQIQEPEKPQRPNLPCPRQRAEDEDPKQILEELYADAADVRKRKQQNKQS